MFLTQNLYFTQQATLSLLQGLMQQGFILPLRLDKLAKDYCGIELAPISQPPPATPALPPQQ